MRIAGKEPVIKTMKGGMSLNNRSRDNIKKNAAVLIGLFLIFITFGSAFYVASESGHTCSADDCPICECVKECANLLRQVGGSILPQISVMSSFLLIVLAKNIQFSIFSQDSLVSKKVRMND